MADDNDKKQEEELNKENDAREEDTVKDVDADTKDVEDTQTQDFDATEKRFSSIEAQLDKILGAISSLREAQGIMVENGAVIQDTDTDMDFTKNDAFVPPA
jgi:hypothetical protein